MKKALVATNLVEKVDIKTDAFIHFKHPVENQNLEFWEKKKPHLDLEQMQGALMMVATLIAKLAFQVGTNRSRCRGADTVYVGCFPNKPWWVCANLERQFINKCGYHHKGTQIQMRFSFLSKL